MSRKRTSKSRKNILRKVFLFTIAIILSYLFIFKTDYFNVKHIEVSGNKKLTSQEIIKASLCNKGENILKFNIRKGEESINSLPYIKNCRIKREFPDKIVIQVEERMDAAVVPYSNSFAIIDKEGYVLSIEKDDKNFQIPRIIGLEPKEIKVSDNLFYKLQIDNIEEFIDLADRMGFLNKMEYIDLSDDRNIIFKINNGTNVAFGSLDNVKYKLGFLIKILEDLNKKDIKARQIFFNK